MTEPTKEQLQAQWSEELLEFIRSVRIARDIYDRVQREAWLRKWALKRFRKDGELLRTLVLRAQAPVKGVRDSPNGPYLAMFTMNVSYETAHMAPKLAAKAAELLQASQLYWVTEAWFTTHARLEDHVQPRHDPKRRESLVVMAEDPFHMPPQYGWTAEITRDARGKPNVASWQPMPFSDGRLTYLLPPAAYLAAGQPVPQS